MSIYFTLTTIALVLLVAYTLIVCVHEHKIPNSLSATVFFYPRDFLWAWMLVMTIITFTLAPVLIDTAARGQMFAFLACAGLLVVGACPLVRNHKAMAFSVHNLAAVVCAVSANLLVLLNHWWLVFCWAPWLCAFIWITKDGGWRTRVFWAEMTCFLMTFAHVYISI